MRRIFLLMLVGAGAAGCGQSDQPAEKTQQPVAAAPAAKAEQWGSSSITGRVSFTGALPSLQRIRMGADPACEAMHGGPVYAEDVLVNDDRTLRNVFVYIKAGLGGRKFAAPRQPVVLDQRGCIYHPRVQGVQAGQPILIRNSDDTLHNVHAVAQNNPQFNIGQPAKGMETIRAFANPEVMVRFKCDVHPWMNSYIGVLAHPYHSVTGEAGAFALRNLPAGEYLVEAWHEKFGSQTQTVTLDKDQTRAIEFTFGD